MIDAQALRRLNPGLAANRAEAYAAALADACERSDISTAIRLRHFMAQLAHESSGFQALVESMAYRDPVRLDAIFKAVKGRAHAERLIAAGPVAIGNCVYANKLGNGGEASGDGFRYRGRGFIMVTGRANYKRVQDDSALPVVAQPDLLGQPGPAAEASARFWTMRRINDAADSDDVVAVTKLVVGPSLLHLDRRKAWLAKTAQIWG